MAWEFDSHTKILGSHYSIYADFECLCQNAKLLCDLCLAKLEVLVDPEKIAEIRASCNHLKTLNRKCPECFIKVSSMSSKIEAKCKEMKHSPISQDGLNA